MKVNGLKGSAVLEVLVLLEEGFVGVIVLLLLLMVVHPKEVAMQQQIMTMLLLLLLLQSEEIDPHPTTPQSEFGVEQQPLSLPTQPTTSQHYAHAPPQPIKTATESPNQSQPHPIQ